MRKRASLIAVCLAAGWARARFVPVIVRGYSMSDVLVDGQRVLARRTRHTPSVGDVIVFQPADDYTVGDESPWLIKRVIAKAGDRRPAQFDGSTLLPTVPPGHVAVIGQSGTARSTDSRYLGYIPVENILGTVVLPRRLSKAASQADLSRSVVQVQGADRARGREPTAP